MKNLFFFVIVILLFIGCTSKEIDYINLKFGESPFVFDSIFHQNQGHKTFVFYKAENSRILRQKNMGMVNSCTRLNLRMVWPMVRSKNIT